MININFKIKIFLVLIIIYEVKFKSKSKKITFYMNIFKIKIPKDGNSIIFIINWLFFFNIEKFLIS